MQVVNVVSLFLLAGFVWLIFDSMVIRLNAWYYSRGRIHESLLPQDCIIYLVAVTD